MKIHIESLDNGTFYVENGKEYHPIAISPTFEKEVNRKSDRMVFRTIKTSKGPLRLIPELGIGVLIDGIVGISLTGKLPYMNGIWYGCLHSNGLNFGNDEQTK